MSTNATLTILYFSICPFTTILGRVTADWRSWEIWWSRRISWSNPRRQSVRSQRGTLPRCGARWSLKTSRVNRKWKWCPRWWWVEQGWTRRCAARSQETLFLESSGFSMDESWQTIPLHSTPRIQTRFMLLRICLLQKGVCQACFMLTWLVFICLAQSGPVYSQPKHKFNITKGSLHKNANMFDKLVDSGGIERNFSLTVTSVTSSDLGQYSCVALNNGGMAESNVTLTFTDPLLNPINMNNMTIIVGVAAGAICILVIFIVVLCCCCRWNNFDWKYFSSQQHQAITIQQVVISLIKSKTRFWWFHRIWSWNTGNTVVAGSEVFWCLNPQTKHNKA